MIPKVALIVLNYNGLPQTLDCIDSLRRADTKVAKTEIIVVENSSEDGSQDALCQIKDIHLVQNQKNLGFAGGMNAGIKFAQTRGTDYFIILNNDTVVDPDLVKNLVKAAKNAHIVAPKIYFAAGYEFHKSRYKKGDLGKVIWYAGGKIDWQNILGIHIGVDEIDTGQFDSRQEIDLATGCCMLIRSEVIDKIGIFDEKYFLYLEDMDFCVRAKKAGFKIMFEPKAMLWHKNAASSGSGSPLQDYYISRNRLIFAAKYANLKTKVALLRHLISQSKNKIKRKALFDFFTLNYGQGNY